MSNCKGKSEPHHFKTIYDHTVPPVTFRIAKAQPSWKLEFKIYKDSELVEKWNEENGRLTRIDPVSWKLNKYKEQLEPYDYDYLMCYLIDPDDDVKMCNGKLTVESPF